MIQIIRYRARRGFSAKAVRAVVVFDPDTGMNGPSTELPACTCAA